MFCPKCAAQNIDGGSFCRVCGANISLVQQALTGQLQQAAVTDDLYDRKGRRRKRVREIESPPSLEKGIVNIFAGLGFIVAALAIMLKFPSGFFWGWAFFFPAFDRLGRGVAAIAASRKLAARMNPVPLNNYMAPVIQGASPAGLAGSRGRNTGEMVPPPPSVTEGTTRHLGAEAPTRHLDSSSDSPK